MQARTERDVPLMRLAQLKRHAGVTEKADVRYFFRRRLALATTARCQGAIALLAVVLRLAAPGFASTTAVSIAAFAFSATIR